MRSEQAPTGVLIFGAVAMLVASYVLWKNPGIFARRNFPFNLTRDQSTPRRGFPAIAFLVLAIALLVLAVVS